MLFTHANLSVLASHLTVERKRQGLTRAQAASICNVSASFIRDAESNPGRCSMGLLLQYMTGLGLSMDVTGWSHVQVQTDFPTDSQDPESKKP